MTTLRDDLRLVLVRRHGDLVRHSGPALASKTIDSVVDQLLEAVERRAAETSAAEEWAASFLAGPVTVMPAASGATP